MWRAGAGMAEIVLATGHGPRAVHNKAHLMRMEGIDLPRMGTEGTDDSPRIGENDRLLARLREHHGSGA
jgi:hypothetical protein